MGIREPMFPVKSIKIEYLIGNDLHVQGFVNPQEVVINPDYIYVVDSEGNEIQYTRRHVLRTTKVLKARL